ncbi:MAG TPA: nitroreductase/quinone reductase family protein [Anaerolineales bacterium]|nr:nitroreductase/quinone reductase family protein [Anaerolineales bacterium]
MAGKMKPIQQNAFQKVLHRVTATRPVVDFFAPRIHRIDLFVLKLTGGKYTLAEIAGWMIIQLTTIGAKTGQERTLPLLAGVDGDTIALIASSFGRERNPGWYYNLKKNPECKITYKGNSSTYVAREVSGDEYDTYWKVVSSTYPSGYAYYRTLVSRRHIPVMVLEPKK